MICGSTLFLEKHVPQSWSGPEADPCAVMQKISLCCSKVTLRLLEPEDCSHFSAFHEECSASLPGMSLQVLKA